jgi:hypothetical protein
MFAVLLPNQPSHDRSLSSVQYSCSDSINETRHAVINGGHGGRSCRGASDNSHCLTGNSKSTAGLRHAAMFGALLWQSHLCNEAAATKAADVSCCWHECTLALITFIFVSNKYVMCVMMIINQSTQGGALPKTCDTLLKFGC